MPNGWNDTAERFRELEEPLRSIDLLFEQFAGRVGGSVGRNYHEHPERRITIHSGNVVRCVCVSVVTGGEEFRPGPNRAAYILTGFAWRDAADGRWLWDKRFCYWSTIPSDAEVEKELDVAWRQTQEVTAAQMTFVPSYESRRKTERDGTPES